MKPRDAILIVDDEPGITYLLKKEISKHFKNTFEYETALSARQALQVIDTMVQDGIRVILILSDWLMPEMKGDELLMKVHTQHPDIKAILISGYADPEALQAVKEKVPLRAFLGKPWDKAQLIEEIEKCIAEQASAE